MNQHIDLSEVIARGKISQQQAKRVCDVLADVLCQDLGYTSFIAKWDEIYSRIEILYMRYDRLGWFRIVNPCEKTVNRFIAALPWLATQEPDLAEWKKMRF